jgi:UDP-glucuronate 4-epimerase
MSRDFTYIDDIVEGIARLRLKPPSTQPAVAGSVIPAAASHILYNIGHGAPVSLLDFVDCLENTLGLQALRNYLPMQAGDVVSTWADTAALEARIGFRPQVKVDQGVAAFVTWYRAFYNV